MLAARRKSSVMRTSRGVMAAALLAAATVAAAQQPAPGPTAQAALQRGLSAYQSGQQQSAIPALQEAAATGDASARFFAEFYLARIYAEGVANADHAKAYMLFRKLADENVNVDPHRSQRAPFVAKALIALAGYVRAGVAEIDLAPNRRRAVDYLNHAATFFGDRDAQFELAKSYLGADGSGDDVKRGLHYLSVLTEESHPSAQALLADLLWRGRHLEKDAPRALALITMAAENAPAHERMWIEESYATIFCAATPDTRQQASAVAASWRKVFARPLPEPAGARDLLLERHCADGEKVVIGRLTKAEAAESPPPSVLEPVQGDTPPGIRAAGVLAPAAKK